MTKTELQLLFSSKEYLGFLKFIEESRYFFEKEYCFHGYILEFICKLEDDERKQEIISICIQNYPQVLGFAPRN
jgi:hypothetical protein